MRQRTIYEYVAPPAEGLLEFTLKILESPEKTSRIADLATAVPSRARMNLVTSVKPG